MEGIIEDYMTQYPVNPVTMFKEKYPDGDWTFEKVDEEMICTAHFGDGKTTAMGIGVNKKTAKATASRKAIYRT